MNVSDMASHIVNGFLDAVGDENHIAHRSYDGIVVVPHATKSGAYEIKLNDGSQYLVEVTMTVKSNE